MKVKGADGYEHSVTGQGQGNYNTVVRRLESLRSLVLTLTASSEVLVATTAVVATRRTHR